MVDGFFVTRSSALFRKASDTVTGSTALFNALFLKMSAKKLEMTTRNPPSKIAQAACSRLLPHPKFFPATRILPEYFESFRTKSFGLPSESYFQSRNRFSPKPSRVVAFRKRAGIIWSVSIFSIGRGTAVLFSVINFSLLIVQLIPVRISEFTDVSDFSGNRCCCSAQGAGQEGPGLRPLTSFEVPVGSRDTIFSSRDLVFIHCQTCRAAGFTKFKTSGFENLVQAFFSRLLFHLFRAGNYPYLDVWGFRLAFDHFCDETQIFNPGIRATSDEYIID